jgi:hypothetical protein
MPPAPTLMSSALRRCARLGDAPVHLAQRVEHAVVEVAPVDEGLDALAHALAGPATTRAFIHA